jgi:hypothetical protein
MFVGQKVRVRLAGVDPYKAYIDFEGKSKQGALSGNENF